MWWRGRLEGVFDSFSHTPWVHCVLGVIGDVLFQALDLILLLLFFSLSDCVIVMLLLCWS